MKCSACQREIGNAGYCKCGWKAHEQSIEKPKSTKSGGISDCEWVSDGEQCHYPGTISHHTNGTGPFFCRFHAAYPTAAKGSEYVIRSRLYVPQSRAERDHEAVFGAKK